MASINDEFPSFNETRPDPHGIRRKKQRERTGHGDYNGAWERDDRIFDLYGPQPDPWLRLKQQMLDKQSERKAADG